MKWDDISYLMAVQEVRRY